MVGRGQESRALRSFYVIVVIITIATCKYYFLLPFHRVTNLLSQFFFLFFFCTTLNRGLVIAFFEQRGNRAVRFALEKNFAEELYIKSRLFFKLVHISCGSWRGSVSFFSLLLSLSNFRRSTASRRMEIFESGIDEKNIRISWYSGSISSRFSTRLVVLLSWYPVKGRMRERFLKGTTRLDESMIRGCNGTNFWNLKSISQRNIDRFLPCHRVLDQPDRDS